MSIHPILAAAVALEHRTELLRRAEQSRLTSQGRRRTHRQGLLAAVRSRRQTLGSASTQRATVSGEAQDG